MIKPYLSLYLFFSVATVEMLYKDYHYYYYYYYYYIIIMGITYYLIIHSGYVK
jgi:hypothetical protein